MNTRGCSNCTFRVDNLPENYSWDFHIADVTCPILGMDFLSHNNLLVDCASRRLISGVKLDTPSVTAASLQTKSIPIKSTTYETPTLYENFIEELLHTLPNLTIRNVNLDTSKKGYFHSIVTPGTLPLRERVRPLAGEKLEFVKLEIDSLLQSGVIRRSSSPWASPIHVVAKDNGKYRLCGDYRRLNAATIHDSYPMPLISEVFNHFPTAKIFSTLDLTKAYHQIPVFKDDIQKTAIITPLGLFEYLRMPFGLRNASQTFQRHIHNILSNLDFVVAYIDDLIVGSSSPEEHITHLKKLLHVLNDNNLQINVGKCQFFKTEVQFLGHLISESGLRPIPSRLQTIRDMPRPETTTQLRSFLGIINYCHRFIPKISEILSPLSAVSHGPKKAKINWSDTMIEAFGKAKNSLASIQTLSFLKPNIPLTLTTDASDFGVGAVLQQMEPSGPKPLEFFSKKMNDAQRRYSAFDRELLAIYLAVKHFRHLVDGRKLTIFSDHKPLSHVISMKNPTQRQLRQISFISEFTTDIKYIAGKDNVVADCLSRTTCAVFHDPLFSLDILQENSPSTSDIEHFIATHSIVNGIHCDTSRDGILRPILASNLREQAMKAVHNLHHPGASSTFELLRKHVVWPFMNKEIKEWVANCTDCQRCKVDRHIKPPIIRFPTGNRFDVVHIDLVGPLPISNGFSYIFTMIDRKTRWTEAIPLKTITAEVVGTTFIREWIARYGIPRIIVTDRGTQFESELFNVLSSKLGAQRFRTTAYHPQTNGMIERYHRTLKQSLRILAFQANWTSSLPFVLLGWRNTPSRATNASPAQLLFGTNTTVPNELIDFRADPTFDDLDRARKHFLALDTNPLFSAGTSYKPYIPTSLAKASHVWIRSITDTALSARYLGPYPLISINENVAKIQIDKKIETINLSRLKPAFGITTDNEIISEPVPTTTPNNVEPDYFRNHTNEPDQIEHTTELQEPIHTNIPIATTTNESGMSAPSIQSPEIILPRSILRAPQNFDRPSSNTRSKTLIRLHPWVREQVIGSPTSDPQRLRRL